MAMEETIVAARNLQHGDVFPGGGGTVTDVFYGEWGVVSVEVDYRLVRGPWNHGDPVIIHRETSDA